MIRENPPILLSNRSDSVEDRVMGKGQTEKKNTVPGDVIHRTWDNRALSTMKGHIPNPRGRKNSLL